MYVLCIVSNLLNLMIKILFIIIKEDKVIIFWEIIFVCLLYKLIDEFIFLKDK